MGSEIQKLNHRHQLIMRLVLAGQYNVAEIARLCGYAPSSMSLIINSPLFQAELARRREKLDECANEEAVDQMQIARVMLNNAAPEAVAVIDKLAHSAVDESVQLRAADIILKMTLGENSKSNNVTQVVLLDASKLGFLEKVLGESEIIEGEIVSDGGSEATSSAA
jgi:hypothetical protein